MSEKIKTLNIEGDTYVIPGEDKINPAEITDVTDPANDWNNFNTYGDEAEEAKYIPNPDISDEELNHILDRAKKLKLKIGKSALDTVFGRAA